MAFWLFMLVCDLLTPGLMMLVGWITWKHPPKDINALYGYRTSRSMKNQETWRFAQEHCGRTWWYLGLTLAVPSVIPMLFVLYAREDTVSLTGVIVLMVQMAVLVASIIPTEIALRKNFDKDGNRMT